MSKSALVCLVLLFCLGQSGCDRKPSFQIPVEQPTHDAAGYLIQPEQGFLVGGESRGWKHLFIQFEVSGQEANPFILSIGNETLPNDNWPLAPENTPIKQAGSGFMFSKVEETPRPLEWFSLNSEDIAKLAEGVQKYFQWSDTAAKENLNVAEKVLVSFAKQEVDNITNAQGEILIGSTNRQVLRVSFSKPKESSKSFVDVFISEPVPYTASLPSFCSITLDKMGVERLLSVITNLSSRREKFVAFRDEQEKITRQRREAQQSDKARADELLH
jgi:hypothetical protein